MPPVTRQMVSLQKGKEGFEKNALPLSSPQTSFWVQTEPVILNITGSISCHPAPQAQYSLQRSALSHLVYTDLCTPSYLTAQGFQRSLLPNLISVFKPEGAKHCREVPSAQYSLAREIGHMDKSVVERSKDVADAEHIFSFSNLRSQADDLFFLLLLALTRCHF